MTIERIENPTHVPDMTIVQALVDQITASTEQGGGAVDFITLDEGTQLEHVLGVLYLICGRDHLEWNIHRGAKWRNLEVWYRDRTNENDEPIWTVHVRVRV